MEVSFDTKRAFAVHKDEDIIVDNIKYKVIDVSFSKKLSLVNIVAVQDLTNNIKLELLINKEGNIRAYHRYESKNIIK